MLKENKCKAGQGCSFAHNKAEITNPRYKIENCYRFLEGNNWIRNMEYKNKWISYFSSLGKCPYTADKGSHEMFCSFIHDEHWKSNLIAHKNAVAASKEEEKRQENAKKKAEEDAKK